MGVGALAVLVVRLVVVSVRTAGAAEPGIAGVYVGPGSCAAQNCHGSVTARADSPTALLNEYVTWHKEDRHAKAYDVLTEPRSLSIAKRLGMREPPTAAAKCLDCHATNAPSAERGPKFRIEDGVTCEACHGPAGGWLARHTEKGWTSAQSRELGMLDTAEPAAAARTCMACHYGNAKQLVDHEMLAAGHPALVFELDSFGTNVGHWKKHDGNAAWFTGGAWAAGQAVALREAANRLARDRGRSGWPEFSLYDCYACHHDIGRDREGNWTVRGSGGRPPVDGSRWSGMSMLTSAVAPAQNRLVRDAIARFEALAAEGERGAAIAPAAEAASARADQVLGRTANGALDPAEIDAVLRELTSAPGVPSFREAQQRAWGIAAMVDARASSAGAPSDDARVQGAIDRMFDAVDSSSRYDPSRFARDVAAVRAALGLAAVR